jgi:PAS domain S-box-containing protein/putative nucleotidyltransferase with HDIG domain
MLRKNTIKDVINCSADSVLNSPYPAMAQELRVLHLEDNVADAELIKYALQQSDYAPKITRVQTEADFLKELDGDYDIILADFDLPQYDGRSALNLVQARGMITPFLIVSGAIREEIAIACMREGAADYLFKDRLGRLGPSVARALDRKREQDQKREAEEALRESEERFRQLTENIQEVFWMTDLERSHFLYVSLAYEQIWGRSRDALYSSPNTFFDAVHPDDRERVLAAIQNWQEYDEVYRILPPDGTLRWVHDRAFPVYNEAGDVYRIAGIAQDITNQQISQETLERQLKEQSVLKEVASYAANSQALDDLIEQITRVIGETFELENFGFGFVAEGGSVVRMHQSYIERSGADFSDIAMGTGVTGTVAQTGKHLLINDVSESDIYFEVDIKTRSELCVPINVSTEIVGVINAESSQVNAFSHADMQLLVTVADLVSTAIARTQLFEAELRYRAELDALRHATLRLTSNLELVPLLEATLMQAIKLMNADTAYVYLFDGLELSFGAAYWDRQLQDRPISWPRPDGLTYQVARSGERVFIERTKNHPQYKEWDWDGANVTLPLKVEEMVRGVMIVTYSSPHQFDEGEVRLLNLFAAQTGVALRNAQLFSDTQRALAHAQAMYHASRSTIALENIQDLLLSITNNVAATLEAYSVVLIVFNVQMTAVTNYIAGGPGASEIKQDTFEELEMGLTGWAIRNRKPVLSRSDEPDPREAELLQQRRVKKNLGDLIVVPLIYRDRVFGTMTVVNQPGSDSFGQNEVELVSAMANQTAVTLENAKLLTDLKKSNEELTQAYNETISGWAQALELRDHETQGHSERVTALTLELAKAVGIPDTELEVLRRGALLHDIGKMALPDEILHKPGPLNPTEWIAMRRHPEYARDMLIRIEYLQKSIDIPYCHIGPIGMPGRKKKSLNI